MEVDAGTIPNRRALESTFEQLRPRYAGILVKLESRIQPRLESLGIHPTIKYRVKSFTSYFKKLLRMMQAQGSNGCQQQPIIADVLGIRIICPFLEDLHTVEEVLKQDFDVLEVERKGSDLSFKEFGYESTHMHLKVPRDLLEPRLGTHCHIFEVQIRTILQDAWAEVEHELVYKADFNPFDEPMKRKLAALNANLSLSDIIFQEIRDYQRRLGNELSRRRANFHSKIESSTDGLLLDAPLARPTNGQSGLSSLRHNASMDDLLLLALQAHNNGDFQQAVDTYSSILKMSPRPSIQAMVHVHRGMAYFAQSLYQEAVDDFTATMELDSKNYKAPYYRAVSHAIREEYSAAIEDFNRSLKINPFQYFALFRRGQAYFHVGDYAKARSDCEKALSLEPDSLAARRFLELVRRELGM